jgi:uncharacterized protein YdhG (YjbR/CyaY superfamily)
MQSKATTPEEYIAALPEDRQAAMIKLRATIKKNLPKGFEEKIGYGMIAYVVSLKTYPAGYHCNPSMALSFICIAAQKNFISLYHMGVYADKKLLDWFTAEYAKAVPTKLDMGKSCIRFKKLENIPYKLIGELAAKMSPKDWIELYEKNLQTYKKSK